MDHIIKKLRPNDVALAKQLIKLWEDLWQAEERALNNKMPNDSYLEDLLLKDSFHAFVAIKDDLVIGGLTAYELPMLNPETKEMFLYDIGVDENHRQKGIAGKLIDALKDLCTEEGIKTIFVGTDTDNEQAKQLYRSTGGDMEEIAWFTYNLKTWTFL